jgi:hypothetical protein
MANTAHGEEIEAKRRKPTSIYTQGEERRMSVKEAPTGAMGPRGQELYWSQKRGHQHQILRAWRLFVRGTDWGQDQIQCYKA